MLVGCCLCCVSRVLCLFSMICSVCMFFIFSMLFLLLFLMASQFLYAEECALPQLTHLRRLPFQHAPWGQLVSAHLTHLLTFLQPLFRCPNFWQFVHLRVLVLRYFLMVVVVLPMVSFVCRIFFSALSFATLKRINVEDSVPLVFLWMPSVPMLLFLSSSTIFWMLRLGGIWFMQSHGLVSALPARCI